MYFNVISWHDACHAVLSLLHPVKLKQHGGCILVMSFNASKPRYPRVRFISVEENTREFYSAPQIGMKFGSH